MRKEKQLNFYLAKGDQKIGPYSTEQIEIFLRQGLVTTTDQVWAEGWPSWLPIDNVPGLTPAQSPEQATPAIESRLPSMATAHSQLEQVTHNLATGPIEHARRIIPLHFCILLGILLPLYSILSFTVTQALWANLYLQGISNNLSKMDSSNLADDAANKINQNISQTWYLSWTGQFSLIPNGNDIQSAIQQKMADNLSYLNLLSSVNFILGGIILLTLFVLMMKSNFFRNIGRARWIRFPLAFPITTIVAVLLIGWNLLLLLLQTSTTADPDAASIWNQSANFITRPLGFFVIISAIRYVGMEVNSQTAKTA